MAKNRAKKINLGLMQRNRRKKYEDHNLNQPDNPTDDIQTKTIETGTYNLINRPRSDLKKPNHFDFSSFFGDFCLKVFWTE